MPFLVKSRHTHPESLRKHYAEAVVLDVTSRGPEPWVRFSPFYPHGGIPVPFSPERFSTTVEGIWQGLKVFETADVDPSKLLITDGKNIKRSVQKYGRVLGHRAGLAADGPLLSYAEARRRIYLPTYRWVLEHCLQDLLGELRQLGRDKTVVLLDYETNAEPDNLSRPLSHAALVRLYLEDNWPI